MEPTFTTRWLYNALESKQVAPGREVCAMCGLPMAEGVEAKKVFRKTFTDYGALRRPASTRVCEACAWYFDNQALRASGWVLSKSSARKMSKADWLPELRGAIESGRSDNRN